MSDLTRWKLTIEYEGTDYAGWQRQDGGIPTIQGAVEAAIHKFSGQDVTITAAGRTDAGVHARGQVAHVDLADFSKPMSPFEVAKAINAHLRPAPIVVVDARVVDAEFHARFSATSKIYHYRIINRGALLGLDEGRAWHVKRTLDVAAMQNAAQILVGQHDFTTFRDSECQAKSPVKTLDRLEVTVMPYDDFGGQDILIAAQGRSFLHHQVRNMAGTLALVGEGKWSAADLQAALDARDRTRGGPTAPAAGLCLLCVLYAPPA